MDRYDAILEHLMNARSRGIELATGRLNAALENLKELIKAAESTVQDALPEDAEEIFPLTEVEELIAEMRNEPAPAVGITLDNLRTLDSARSQSELLRALLPMLTEHVGRAVVLVIRDGVISAWSGIGFSDGENLRSWHGGVGASPEFQHLSETSKPLSVRPASDPLISKWLAGEKVPDEAVLLPISLRGKLMGIVYIDHDGDDPWNVEAAQALNAVACWLIDTLHHRATVPTPTLAEVAASVSIPTDSEVAEVFEPPTDPEIIEPSDEEEGFDAAPPAEESVEEPVEEPPVEEIASESVVDEDSYPPADSEEPVEIDYDFEPEPPPEGEVAADAGFDPSATVRVEIGEHLGAPEIPPQAEVVEPPPPEPVTEVEAQAADAEAEIVAPPPVQPVEPPGVTPEPGVAAGEAPDERSSEDEARQEEARRFARLLVSEIKLYNEDEVERGRSEKDLGERLNDDIERSREMFEKRIPAEVRDGHDYFRDELVRILADGDPDALGM